MILGEHIDVKYSYFLVLKFNLLFLYMQLPYENLNGGLELIQVITIT